MAVSLDAKTIRILEEGRVIIGPVVRARAGFAMVATAVTKPGGVEAINAVPCRCRKTDMQSGGGLIRHGLLALEHPEFDRFVPIPQ